MVLVTSSSFKILLNGSPSKPFNPSRGLRQGYPLSPFLFILMIEGLGQAIKSTKVEGKIQGLKLTMNGNALTHQQFVDDTMLQGTPTVREALAYKQILKDFAMVVGTKVSLSKSNIFFFNTDIAIQRNISRILGFQRDMLPSKYLGVPLTDKPLSKMVWEPVINKLQDKVQKWTRSLVKVRADRRNRSNLSNFTWQIARWLSSQTDPKSTLTTALLDFGSGSSVKHQASYTDPCELLASGGYLADNMREGYQRNKTRNFYRAISKGLSGLISEIKSKLVNVLILFLTVRSPMID
eukprot:PITA_28078